MSQAAYDELQRIRREAIEKQTCCSYCDKVCQNADHLYLHIILRHK